MAVVEAGADLALFIAPLAHALGREVVLITQSGDDVPFDLRHLRYVKYLPNTEGLAALKAELVPRLENLMG